MLRTSIQPVIQRRLSLSVGCVGTRITQSGSSVINGRPYSEKTFVVDDESLARRKLAAAFRFFASEKMNEGVANHFSYMLDGRHMLVNGFGRHFATIKASELVKVDLQDPSVVEQKGPHTRLPLIDPTAWCIHGALHRRLGQRGRCIFHLHPQNCTALSALKDPSLPPIDQNTMRWHNRLAYDLGFAGMGLGDEASRLAEQIGDHSAMIMGSHGCIVVGKTVGHCIDAMYYLEMSARCYLTALASGKPLRIVADEIAETTAAQWDDILDISAEAMMQEVFRLCDRDAADYKY